jgi:tRNA(adenine34) deaminase
LDVELNFFQIQTVDMFTHEYFMKQALVEAQKAYDKDEIPVGAIVVADNLIIARSYNLTETLNDVTAHAEIQALTAASEYLGSKYLDKCTLYVTLEPCVMCAGALYWAQLGQLVFGALDEKRGYSLWGGAILHPKTMVISGVFQNEAAQLMKDFFARKR